MTRFGWCSLGWLMLVLGLVLLATWLHGVYVQLPPCFATGPGGCT